MGFGPIPFNPAVPGAIGGTTPSAITGTTLTATTVLVVPNGSTTVPAIHGTVTDLGISFEPSGTKGFYLIVGGSPVFAFFGSGQASLPFIVIDNLGTTSCAIRRAVAGTGVYCDSGTGSFGFSVATVSVFLAGGTTLDCGIPLKLKSYTVSGLPAAATVGAGATAFVTDASTTILLGLGTAVLGSGSNKVPVYSDGTNWIIG